MPHRRRIKAWARLRRRNRRPVRLAENGVPGREPRQLVVILDGTMSTLKPGYETHAGRLWKLLKEDGTRADRSVYYEAGVQWKSWRSARDVALGRGINRQIERAYGFLASRYRPGDKIYLFGFSRGAFAVRSLAGILDEVGLLDAPDATQRFVAQAYRHYRMGPSDASKSFSNSYCRRDITVEMIGVWDTVKALGLRAPLIWRLSQPTHAFHNHHLSSIVRHGYHAVAMDETRLAFAPEMWVCPEDWTGHVEQMWFSGTHGDVGGQLGGWDAAQPLSNISLCWMLGKAEGLGLELPRNWRSRFPRDPCAPSVGAFGGAGKLFLLRARRKVGVDASEHVHPTVAERQAQITPYRILRALGLRAGTTRMQE